MARTRTRTRNRRRMPDAPANEAQPSTPQGVEVFTFGDPEPALNQTLFDYLCVCRVHDYFEPPVSWDGLAKTLRTSPHHGSAIALKRNLLTRFLRPHNKLAKQEFSGAVFDYLTFGNAFLQGIKNRKGGIISIKRAMARFTRVGTDPDIYWHLPNDPFSPYGFSARGEPYPAGAICHLQESDVAQNIYGTPDYLSSLQAAWLNEAATLFRRRYYVNGTHAGFILYINDPLQKTTDIEMLKKKMQESKGPGNFRNLLLYSPDGKKDGIQLIHTGEAAAKDEFLRIKNVSRDDVLAAHRVPPQLIGLVPENAGGFGSADEAMRVFYQLEILPLQEKLQAVNDWAQEEIVQFEAPAWALDPAPAPNLLPR